MIKLTRLNRSPLFVNLTAIQYLESSPDTVVAFVNGDRILVLESIDDVVDKALRWQRKVQGAVRKKQLRVSLYPPQKEPSI